MGLKRSDFTLLALTGMYMHIGPDIYNNKYNYFYILFRMNKINIAVHSGVHADY